MIPILADAAETVNNGMAILAISLIGIIVGVCILAYILCPDSDPYEKLDIPDIPDPRPPVDDDPQGD
jgi:hypothetical protein